MRLLAEKMHIFADSLTVGRFFVSFFILFSDSILNTAILVVIGWASDMFDGFLARRYGGTHLGKFDLYADLTFSASILVNLVNRGCVSPQLAIVFTILFIGAYLLTRNEAPMMLWMALIYGRFLLAAWLGDRTAFAILAVWITLIPILTPHRSMEQISHFFREIKKLT